MAQSISLDHSLGQTTLISAIYPVGPAAIILMPLIVGGLIDSFGFSEQQAGAVATAEGIGLVSALLLASQWVRRVSWPIGLLMGLVIYAMLNLASTFIHAHTPLMLIRFCTGFAGGSVFAIIVAALGDNKEPDRAFGIAQAVQGLLMGVLFTFAPVLMVDLGVHAVFYLMAGLAVLTALFIPRFPHHGIVTAQQVMAAPATVTATPLLYLGLFGGFVYYLAVFGFWGFIERIGQQAGLDPQTIGTALGVSQLAAIVGALSAAVAAQRFGRSLPLLLALIGQLWVLWLLVGQFSTFAFYAGACAYQGLYVMATSYQLGVIATLDNKGQFIVLMTALQGLGASIGPSAAAWLLTDSGYTAINTGAALAVGLSLGIFLVIVWLYRSAESAGQANSGTGVNEA